MTVSSQSYRNTRKGYYTDYCVETTPIGAIVPTFKTEKNSYDHQFIKSSAAPYPAFTESSGNAYENLNNSKITELVITNTIPKNHNSLKVREISAAEFLSKTIKAVVANESISLTWKSNNK